MPLDPQQVKAFQDRLLGSNEIFSTFGLANSLAGFLVGPLVLALAMVLQNLAEPDGRGDARCRDRPGGPPPALPAHVPDADQEPKRLDRPSWWAAAVLAWQARRRVRRPAPGRGAASRAWCVIGALVAAGLATGRLDREVLTQSTLSMRYRWEYWQGAWGVITGGRRRCRGPSPTSTFWAGVGPGNFGAHYLLLQAARVERGDPGPAQPVPRGLGDRRVLGRARAGRGPGAGPLESARPAATTSRDGPDRSAGRGQVSTGNDPGLATRRRGPAPSRWAGW